MTLNSTSGGPTTTRAESPSPSHPPKLPPRWFIRLAWAAHRGVYRITSGRVGLWRPTPRRGGMLRLTTVGRRSGKETRAMLGYVEDGPNLVVMAMNGWGAGDPAWWLNLQHHPDAIVDLPGGSRRVRARAARQEEHERLWGQMQDVSGSLDRYAALRPQPTTLVVLESVLRREASAAEARPPVQDAVNQGE